jgi:hypothetical protein
VVAILEKDRFPAITALGHLMRKARNDDAGEASVARHGAAARSDFSVVISPEHQAGATSV